jgi:proline-specific peptidase
VGSERTLTAAGFDTYCRIVGEPTAGRLPLVTAHGGPGASHDYLHRLEALSGRREVVFFDQVGAGRSAGPVVIDDYTVELHVRQLLDVADALAVDRFHLLGHSWGGMLGLEVALAAPERLASLVMVGGYPSTPQVLVELDRLRQALNVDHSDSDAVIEAFMSTHFCRDETFLRWLFTEAPPLNSTIYGAMWGPSEFECTGALREWDVRGRLDEIHVPVLVTGGRFDEITPAIHESTYAALPNARIHIFEHSSHMPFVEETDEFVRVVADFLSDVEREL